MGTNETGSIERTTPELDELLDKDAPIEVLAEGFTWTEGPVWIGGAKDGHLLFSEYPVQQHLQMVAQQWCVVVHVAIGLHRRDLLRLEPGSNGLILDREGRLVLCEHGDRRVSVLTKDGGKMTLADRYQGKRLNSPNDAAP